MIIRGRLKVVIIFTVVVVLSFPLMLLMTKTIFIVLNESFLKLAQSFSVKLALAHTINAIYIFITLLLFLWRSIISIIFLIDRELVLPLAEVGETHLVV